MNRIHAGVQPPPVIRGVGPDARPLTHHEILSLMGPFTRRGRHADMPSCRRTERKLVFAPLDHPPSAAGRPGLREVLSLEARETGWFRLVRRLTPVLPDAGATPPSATLSAAGEDLEALLAQVETVPPARQFAFCEGALLERSYRMQPGPGGGADGCLPVLIRARALAQGVTLELDADHGGGLPVQVRLIPPAGRRLQIPQDLLAVLGRDWWPLDDYDSHWRGAVRAARQEPARTADIEAKLARAVAHLTATLQAAPEGFHSRHHRQRWRVVWRRATPALATLGLIAATPAVSLLPADEGTLLRMLALQVPALMLVGLLALSELPRIEIPPLPRNLTQSHWLIDKS